MSTENQAVEHHLDSRSRNIDSARPTAGHLAIRFQYSQTNKIEGFQGGTLRPLFVQSPTRRDTGGHHQFAIHPNMAECGYYHATRHEDHQKHGRFPEPTPRELQDAFWRDGRLDSG